MKKSKLTEALSLNEGDNVQFNIKLKNSLKAYYVQFP